MLQSAVWVFAPWHSSFIPDWDDPNVSTLADHVLVVGAQLDRQSG